MKGVILFAALLSYGCLNAQSESKIEKKFERYENGELVEDKYYLEKDGKVISGQDFETPSFDDMKAKMDVKRQEMDARMNDFQLMFDQRMVDISKRMLEIQNKATKMQTDIENRIQQRKSEIKVKPSVKSNSGIGTVLT